ncbi:cytochrome P450 [Anaeromyxobacter oryzae]|uniref:Cytochrome P450 n=1 Tax=Anaeromyxobacter oryzae TaxID=2918170 RepID=A0ABM7WPX8_9BACT|nr:cytochrome P450 [Anaeromyxobacter oryzae]BDG01517.1 cytochrome P450 [Anaeromyxobacter oryzae]
MGVFLLARRDPLGFFLESMRRYGDVVCMPFGRRRAYLLSHPEDVRHVLEDDQGLHAKAPTASRVRAVFGDSLTTIDGEHWRRQRRLMRPAFRPRSLLPSLPIVTRTTAQMLDRWASIAARGETVDVAREMTHLTQEVIVELVFGDVGEAQARAVGEALDQALQHANRRLWSPLGSLGLPTPAQRRFQTALRTIDTFVCTNVARACEDAPPAGTLLASLLDAHDVGGGERMRAADLCHELKAILFAGHTTTASALAWTFYVLSTNSAASEAVRAEVREALDGRSPGADDLPTLVHTRRVIDEVLRLYPPTWVTARTLLQDDCIRGHRIAAGSIVLLSPFVTHRHPAFWPEPDRFDPDRFAPERRSAPFAYFPFGGGPRSCIGTWLASIELQLVVAMVAQRYELALVPGSRVDVEPGLTLRPKPGVPMILRPTGTGGLP